MLRSLILVSTLLLVLVNSISAQLTINTPGSSGTTLAAASDYAAEVLHDPWDMDDHEDLSNFILSADNGDGLGEYDFSNGLFSFDINTADNAYFHMLGPGPGPSTYIPVQKTGLKYPIDSTRYRYLVIRMQASVASILRIHWNTGNGYASQFVRTTTINTSTGFNTYVIDLDTISIDTNNNETRGWSEAKKITGLRIEPGTTGSISIDYILLVSAAPETLEIDHSFNPPNPGDTYSLFIDDDQDPSNGSLYTIVDNADSKQTASFDPKVVPPGMYYVTGLVGSTASVSPGTVTINSPPHLKLLQPHAGGEDDYAAEVFGNPWNFDGIDDTSTVSNVEVPMILPNNEIYGRRGDFYCARAPQGLAEPYLNLAKLSKNSKLRMNPFRYKNLRVSTLLDLPQDLTGGSVFRLVVEWNARDNKPLNGDDIILPGILPANNVPAPEDLALGRQWFDFTMDMRDEFELRSLVHPPGTYEEPVWERSATSDTRIEAREVFDQVYQETVEEDPESLPSLIRNNFPNLDFPTANVTVGFDSFQTRLYDPPSGWSYLPTNNYQHFNFSTSTVELGTWKIVNTAACGQFSYPKTCTYNFSCPGRYTCNVKNWSCSGTSCRYPNYTQLLSRCNTQTTKTTCRYRTSKWYTNTNCRFGRNCCGFINNRWQSNARTLCTASSSNQTTRVNRNTENLGALMCLDYVSMRADHTTGKTFVLSADVSDSNTSDDIRIDFYRVITNAFFDQAVSLQEARLIAQKADVNYLNSNGVKIAENLTPEQASAYLYDTSNEPEGEYWIFAIANDGKNTVGALGHRLVIDRSRELDTTIPNFEVSSITDGSEAFRTLILKGYAIDDRQIAAIQVFIDNAFFGLLKTGQFNKTARDMFPEYADASTAGFDSTLDISSLATGVHQVSFVAWDTAGNKTTKNISITRSAGDDPQIALDDTEESFDLLHVPTEEDKFVVKLNTKSGKLVFSILNAERCTSLDFRIGAKKKIFTKNPVAGTLLATINNPSDSIKINLKKLKPLLKKKGNTNPTIGILCNDEPKKNKTLALTKIKSKSKKRVKTTTAYIKQLGKKLRKAIQKLTN